MDILKNYTKYEENLDTLFTIIIHDKKCEDILKSLESQLDKSKNISNPIKKIKINNRLFSIIKYIRDLYIDESIINSIFLVNDKIFEYKLNSNEIKTASEYNFVKCGIKNDKKFLIEYLIDLFYNFNFIYSIKVNKNDLTVHKMNKNKEKVIEETKINNDSKITEVVDNIRKNDNKKDYIIIYGISQYLVKINDPMKNVIIKKEFMNKEEIYELYENEIAKINNQLLEKKLEELTNPKTNLDLFVFGKLKVEFKEAIESYMIKELYIEEKKIENLKRFIDNECLNFKIIPVKSLEDGDIASSFIKDYNGIMGIKYY